jgi:hypothetical protein
MTRTTGLLRQNQNTKQREKEQIQRISANKTACCEEKIHFPLFLTSSPHHFTTAAGLVLGW